MTEDKTTNEELPRKKFVVEPITTTSYVSPFDLCDLPIPFLAPRRRSDMCGGGGKAYHFTPRSYGGYPSSKRERTLEKIRQRKGVKEDG